VGQALVQSVGCSSPIGRFCSPIPSAGSRCSAGCRSSVHRSDPIKPTGITYVVLAPNYAATVTSQPEPPTATSLPGPLTDYYSLALLLLPEHGPRLSYVTTQVHRHDALHLPDVRRTWPRSSWSYFSPILYICRHEIEVGIPSTMHRERQHLLRVSRSFIDVGLSVYDGYTPSIAEAATATRSRR